MLQSVRSYETTLRVTVCFTTWKQTVTLSGQKGMKGSTMFKWQWQVSAQCRQRKLFINYNCNLCCLKLYSNLYVVLENLRLRVEFIPSHLRLWEALKNCWNMTMPLLQYSMHGMGKVDRTQIRWTAAVHCTSLHCTALHDAEQQSGQLFWWFPFLIKTTQVWFSHKKSFQSKI